MPRAHSRPYHIPPQHHTFGPNPNQGSIQQYRATRVNNALARTFTESEMAQQYQTPQHHTRLNSEGERVYNRIAQLEDANRVNVNLRRVRRRSRTRHRTIIHSAQAQKLENTPQYPATQVHQGCARNFTVSDRAQQYQASRHHTHNSR